MQPEGSCQRFWEIAEGAAGDLVDQHFLVRCREEPHTPCTFPRSPPRMVGGLTCTLYLGLWPTQCSHPGPAWPLVEFSGVSVTVRRAQLRSVCRAIRPGNQSLAFSKIPTKPRKEHWNATREVLSSLRATGLIGWGGNWSMGDHTHLPIHFGQRLYILNSCCLC